jgi:hypothetical protein
MVSFTLQLGESYWSKGFFNVPVDVERYLTMTEGPVDIFLEAAVSPIVGRLSRSANLNATPRIRGNKPLIDHFKQNFRQGDTLVVDILSPTAVRIVGRGNRIKP